MATDNRGVMVYLPRDVEEILEKYCTENNITRKNKDGDPVPSLGTGIVQYLKSQLLGIASVNAPSAGLTRDEVLEMVQESVAGHVLGDGLSIERITAIANEEVERAISPVMDKLVNLQSQLDKLLAMPTQSERVSTRSPQVEGKVLSFGQINERHGLSLNRKQSKDEILAVLKESGLGDRYQYKAEKRTFTELE